MLEQFLAIGSVAVRICVGLVFALAAVQKMRHWRLLPGVIGNYHLLPAPLVGPASALLPPVELAVAAGLVAGAGVAAFTAAAVFLLLLFALAMQINITRGRSHIDCGCGQSHFRQSLSGALVVRNILLAGLLIACAGSRGALDWSATFTAAAAGLTFFLLYLAANLLTALPKSGPVAL